MQRSEEIIRLVTAVLATLIAAILALGYSSVNYHNHVEHLDAFLPAYTAWVSTTAPWAFLVPLLVLALGIVWLKRHLAMTILISVAWLFALAWPLTCIVAWEMPFVML